LGRIGISEAVKAAFAGISFTAGLLGQWKEEKARAQPESSTQNKISCQFKHMWVVARPPAIASRQWGGVQKASPMKTCVKGLDAL